MPTPAFEVRELPAPAYGHPVDPIYTDHVTGFRYWRSKSGCLSPIAHQIVNVTDPLTAEWRLLASKADQLHIRMTDGFWTVTDKGLARLNAWAAAELKAAA